MEQKDNNKISREGRGVCTAIVGLVLNLLLGIGKLVAGLLTGSVAVTADGINNLSDVGTSAVTVSSFAISSKQADKEHPFGHGRFEYVAGFIVSAVIILVGGELILSSITRLTGEETVVLFSKLAFIFLCVSVAVKLFMFVFYTIRNRKIKSETLKAASFDSIADAISTTLVGTAFLLDGIVHFPFDAVVGILTSLFIILGGLRLIVSTVNKLIGGAHDEEVERTITQLVAGYDQVLGVHDLMVHDYGAGRMVASLDAEFDMDLPFVTVHNVVDAIEREAYEKLHINLVVHPDPVNANDESYLSMKHAVQRVTEKYASGATFHELTINDNNVSLHLRLNEKLMKTKEVVTAEIIEAVTAVNQDAVVSVQYDFL